MFHLPGCLPAHFKRKTDVPAHLRPSRPVPRSSVTLRGISGVTRRGRPTGRPERVLRVVCESRVRAKVARAGDATTPGLAEMLTRDLRKVGRFYSRCRITGTSERGISLTLCGFPWARSLVWGLLLGPKQLTAACRPNYHLAPSRVSRFADKWDARARRQDYLCLTLPLEPCALERGRKS